VRDLKQEIRRLQAEVDALKAVLRVLVLEKQAKEIDEALSQPEGMPLEEERPLRLFISYAHEDEPLLRKLLKHLAILRRTERIENWHDREIMPGEEWQDEINEHLENADLILLLISVDFLASDYIYHKEMKRALERHEAGAAKVIPIILRHVDWSGSPIESLQVLPKDGLPIVSWDDRDEAWANVARGIRRAIKDLRQQRSEET